MVTYILGIYYDNVKMIQEIDQLNIYLKINRMQTKLFEM